MRTDIDIENIDKEHGFVSGYNVYDHTLAVKSLWPAEPEKQILALPVCSLSLKELLQSQTLLELYLVLWHGISPVKLFRNYALPGASYSEHP